MREFQPRGTPPPADPDGIREEPRDDATTGARRTWQAVALALVAGCVGYVLTPSAPGRAPGPAARPGDVAAEKGRAVPGGLLDGADPVDGTGRQVESADSRPRRREPRRAVQKATMPPVDNPDDRSYLLPPGETRRNLPASEYIQALHEAGIRDGIGAFNPPGTSPPLEGNAVPPDFELPEGYVRHYQTTDDGQSIEPILMYSPDYAFVGEDGQPVEIPEDRVVPADRLPAGMPARKVDIPAPRDDGDVPR